MLQGIVTTLVTGTLLAILADRLARGSRQWRDLTRARHELETAALFTHDTAIAGQLRKRADERMERYLRPRMWHSEETRWRVLLTTLAGLIVAFVAVLSLIALGDRGDRFWVQVLVGATAGLVGLIVTAWIDRSRKL